MRDLEDEFFKPISYDKAILKELQELNRNVDSLRTDVKDLRNEFSQISVNRHLTNMSDTLKTFTGNQLEYLKENAAWRRKLKGFWDSPYVSFTIVCVIFIACLYASDVLKK